MGHIQSKSYSKGVKLFLGIMLTLHETHYVHILMNVRIIKFISCSQLYFYTLFLFISCEVLPKILLTIRQRKVITRAGVYETLCPQHMLAPNNNIDMIPNLDEAHIGKGSKFYRMYSKVIKSGILLIILNEYTIYQGPS